mmetsp:Transcript_54283/g.162466  ORF Transcript_54283/g.162466 Transcript_54283/m.162466 type:complete len:87 (+) Transcript_54283:552-812(+)|eukprot:CAMPEP_0113543306 /NCGR_PEP_ID=MMETSP0015_2-20120614/10086_1 /TAXON_ID=2838 /ORGANISM="Odontella" /LENGTH=86 /DNA_ID=CAMNT_0000443453 /DNA_START=372 /DNA_END=632 /DNA_ORIENTATION=+ /assembly_acc=CAM_ASM_000160
MVRWDGHELAVVGTATGFISVANACLGKGWVKSMIHRQPVVAFSLVLATAGVAMPIFIPPIRRKLGMPTNQYEAGLPGVIYPQIEE